MGYVIFVGQFAGGYELEWPDCGAFWSALPSAIDSNVVSDKKSETPQKAPHSGHFSSQTPVNWPTKITYATEYHLVATC